MPCNLNTTGNICVPRAEEVDCKWIRYRQIIDQTVHRITMHQAMDRRLALRRDGLCKHDPHFELRDVDLAF